MGKSQKKPDKSSEIARKTSGKCKKFQPMKHSKPANKADLIFLHITHHNNQPVKAMSKMSITKCQSQKEEVCHVKRVTLLMLERNSFASPNVEIDHPNVSIQWIFFFGPVVLSDHEIIYTEQNERSFPSKKKWNQSTNQSNKNHWQIWQLVI